MQLPGFRVARLPATLEGLGTATAIIIAKGVAMTTALTRITTPEEAELARYLAQVERLTADVAARETELETLADHLARFQAAYHARVGNVLVEADRLGLAADELRRRTALLRDDPRAAPETIAARVHEELRQAREEAEEAARTSARFAAADAETLRQPHLTGEEQAELVQLFRQLAKRHHPDLGRNERENQARTQVMQQVTAAFHARDLPSLRRLAAAPDIEDTSLPRPSIGERLVWAIRTVAQLTAQRESLDIQLHQLRASSMGVLWTKEQQGEEVLNRLRADAERQLAQAKQDLQAAETAYQQVVRGRP